MIVMTMQLVQIALIVVLIVIVIQVILVMVKHVLVTICVFMIYPSVLDHPVGGCKTCRHFTNVES